MIGLSRAQVVDCKWFSVHCQFKRQDTHNCSSVFIPFSSQRSELHCPGSVIASLPTDMSRYHHYCHALAKQKNAQTVAPQFV